VLSVHDELVFEVDRTTAHDDLRKITSLMEAVPGWARGLPIRADVKLMERYGK